jgi:hypothetical protein
MSYQNLGFSFPTNFMYIYIRISTHEARKAYVCVPKPKPKMLILLAVESKSQDWKVKYLLFIMSYLPETSKTWNRL